MREERTSSALPQTSREQGLSPAERSLRARDNPCNIGILTAILAGGHALLIGVPGLAKTLMVQTVS